MTELSPLKRALLELREMRERFDALAEPAAIVGIGCRFPGGVTDPEMFWSLLRDGRDAVVDVPSDRWDKDALFDPDPDMPGKVTTRRGGFLERIDLFDADFFGITPREAATMDPQQRLLLEVSWEALENAGLSPHALRGSDTGVFVGIGTNDYLQLRAKTESLNDVDPYLATGTSHSVASGRLAFFFGFEGPCLSIDTACSSSLVAAHLALQSLRSRECSLALVAGVNAIATPELSVNFSKARMLAPDGRCKTFDDAADGYVRGEGSAVLVLKRLPDALRSRDRIYAVLRGSAVNQDGRSSGLTVPNGKAQEALLRRALENAGVSPGEVGYVEAHGTGTSLGDPIELGALAAVYGKGRDLAHPLRVGSVKTNVGHLEAAAGVAGLVKAALALDRETIPRQLHFQTPNARVDWDSLPLLVASKATPWERGGAPRFAGVSSFGFSGTNAHVILSEAPASARVESESFPDRPVHLLALSARSEEALGALARRYIEFFNTEALEPSSFADVCFTAGAGRAHFSKRLALVSESASDARSQLEALVRGETVASAVAGAREGYAAPKVAFLFTGQGSQYRGMGRELYESAPVFRQAFETCDEFLSPRLGRSLVSVLYGDGRAEELDRTGITQPVLFAFEWSLAALWRSMGVEPDFVAGHSVGEYVAATLASVFDLETGLALVHERGRLMERLADGGAMACVFTDEANVLRVLKAHPDVEIAALNAVNNTVVSGPRAAVEAVTGAFAAEGIGGRALAVSHAFHSALMEPMLDAFEERVRAASLGAPQIDLVANVSGRIAEDGIRDPRYWREQIRRPVRFAQTIETLRSEGVTLFLEVGPSPVLCGIGGQSAVAETESWLPSLRKGAPDFRTLLRSAAALYVSGVSVDFRGLDMGHPRGTVSLPTYPFERERYWLSERTASRWDSAREAALAASERDATTLASSYRRKWRALDRLSSAYIARTLAHFGFDGDGTPSSVDALLERGVKASYRPLLARWLSRATDEIGVESAREEAERIFGEDRALLEYVVRSGEALPELLVGASSPLEILFPGGSFEAAEALYQGQPLVRYFNDIVVAAAAAADPSRVIEIGAGTGGTTSALVPALATKASRYVFTDVSELFLTRARQKLRGFELVSYARLDVERAPETQGVAHSSFDLVVASNVLHATRHLEQTIANVRKLLAPAGILILCEGTKDLGYLDVTWGLTEGWMRFEDDRLDSPLRPRAWWESALAANGFDRVACFPGGGEADEVLGQHVFVARADGRSFETKRQVSVEIPVVAQSPVAPRVAAGALRAEVSDTLPAERHDRLVAIVRRELAAVMGTTEERAPGRHDRLKDRGVDSLMAVELGSRLATALGLERRLPATLIFEHPTVDAIAVLLGFELEGETAPTEDVATREVAPSTSKSAIEALSEEEAEALLLRKLESM